MSERLRILAVSDLHRIVNLYRDLESVAASVRPDALALVGDFLDVSGSEHEQWSAARCAEHVAALPVPEIILVRGNHEDFGWFEFQDAWAKTARPLIKLHGDALQVGPAVITGFPCLMGDGRAFANDLPSLGSRPLSWLSGILRRYGAAMRTLWLMHEPPSGTPLSQPDSPVAGNWQWRKAIERFKPLLTISGHDHQTPITTGTWWHRIGSTTCVNVGQTENGPLHYCLVQADFQDDEPALPSRMVVTAYPREETLGVYPPAQ